MSVEAYSTRKKIFDEIKKLNRDELEELYRICKKNNETMSENSNGIFMELNNLKDETIEAIKIWLSHCLDNKKNLDKREKEMDDLRNEPLTEDE